MRNCILYTFGRIKPQKHLNMMRLKMPNLPQMQAVLREYLKCINHIRAHLILRQLELSVSQMTILLIVKMIVFVEGTVHGDGYITPIVIICKLCK